MALRVTRAVKTASGREPLVIDFTQRATAPVLPAEVPGAVVLPAGVPGAVWNDEDWDNAYEQGFLHGWDAHEQVILTIPSYLPSYILT